MPSTVESSDHRVANAPYEPGQLVHIRQSSPKDVPEVYHHKHACEIVIVYRDFSLLDVDSRETRSTHNYVYTLSPIPKDSTLSAIYHHDDLLPSPRGYDHIDTLLGEQEGGSPPRWERTLGSFMRSDLELINTCLSVVDFKNDSTVDWMREIRKGDIDRVNSVFAEILLLYHLRTGLDYESVQLNAPFGKADDRRDVDIRVTTNGWDIWLEVYKPDYLNHIPEGGGWISREATGTSMGNKLRKKFEGARNQLPEDAVVILAIYLIESIGQELQLVQWLDKDYFDVGKYCDGLLTFSHLAFPTEFAYYPTTAKGEDCREFIQTVFHNPEE